MRRHDLPFSSGLSVACRFGPFAFETPRTPAAVVDILSYFEIFSLNLFGLGLPLACIGISGFLQQLLSAIREAAKIPESLARPGFLDQVDYKRMPGLCRMPHAPCRMPRSP